MVAEPSSGQSQQVQGGGRSWVDAERIDWTVGWEGWGRSWKGSGRLWRMVGWGGIRGEENGRKMHVGNPNPRENL